MSTELELRLEARIEEAKPQRTYVESWASCRHQYLRLLAEIGSARLDECKDCGLVMGIAR